MPRLIHCALLALLFSSGCGGESATDPEYVAQVDQWHADRIERLRSDTGWLTLVGRHRLQEGVNTLGSGPDATVRMGGAPDRLGEISVDQGLVMFAAAPGADVRLFGEKQGGSLTHIELASDREGSPTRLESGSLVFYVIQRGPKLFLRVKDRQATTLARFSGIERFPVRASWRVAARLEGPPGVLVIQDVIGTESEQPTPGTLVFEVEGRSYRVVPTGRAGDPLFLVFADRSNGRSTYPGGRFLVLDPPATDGTYILDFNKAYNPPCCFTEFATCPLPTAENRLDLEVEAGEKTWGGGH